MVLTTTYPPPRLNGQLSQAAFSPSLSGPFSPSAFDVSQIPILERTTTMLAAPEPMDNIMNRRGGVSLYQSCLALKKKLAEVPGFEPYLEEMDQEERESNDATDPVTSMWNMLRRGFPLMTIYNALRPKVPIEVNQSKVKVAEAKLGKAATFKFLQACLEELKFPVNECFLISDLYLSDTTGLVKASTLIAFLPIARWPVLKVINRVLDILSQRGMLVQVEEAHHTNGAADTQPRSHQQKIIDELVTTERDYVQHLETLQQFKDQVVESGAFTRDDYYDIFSNLDKVLDFQRRFLIRIEQQNSLEPSLQNWGHLFVQYQESFKVYETFIANQQRANDFVSREWERIKSTPLSPACQGMVETQSVLGSFLMKPFVRLTKYPMLLNELKKRSSDLDEDKLQDLQAGSEATSAILARANEAIDLETRAAAREDLRGRVEDWKGHQMERFGNLLIYGTHTVLKGEAAKEVEREYSIYLFERILLCCKDINPNKAKNRLGNKNVDKKGKPRLQLKGRIFMQNVTDILQYTKSGKEQHLLFIQCAGHSIFWKGDPAVESFVIRFPLEEMRNKWTAHVEKQKRLLNTAARTSGQNGTSDQEFIYMRSQTILQNPHEQEDDGDDDTERGLADVAAISAIGTQSHYSMSRNASSTSLRSRSTTSGNSISQLPMRPPPRFHIPDHVHGPNGPPLTISTNISNPGTPDERAAMSYFSPTVESPASMRSSQTGMYQFPRHGLPMSNGWSTEENKHNTAPPTIRSSRDQAPLNTYTIEGRTVLRPSLPAMTASQTAQQLSLTQSRMRSASSPDIQNPSNAGQRRYVNGQIQATVDNIPVPPIPPHMVSMRAPMNRSQTSSPTDTRRNPAQSPKSSRDRVMQQYNVQYSYDQNHQIIIQSNSRYSSGISTNSTPMSAIGERIMSPPIQTPLYPSNQVPCPSQLKVKIWFEPRPSHVTIVVPIIIKHRSLIDRIDSKMEKVTSSSIAKGTARLRYQDSDNEFVTMKCDEDVQIAIEEWVVVHEDSLFNGIIPDFELYWNEIPPQ
ncbi:hypothetical protein MMC13_005238 [Lambiella insularis]|nr:hypothetical protein [Lambiella insularis]